MVIQKIGAKVKASKILGQKNEVVDYQNHVTFRSCDNDIILTLFINLNKKIKKILIKKSFNIAKKFLNRKNIKKIK